MCLYIEELDCDYNWLDQPKPSIAMVDIPVYKVLMQKSDGELVSPYKEETYRTGELKKVWMRKGFLGLSGNTVNYGLHAVRHQRSAEILAYMVDTRYSRSLGLKHRIFHATIPKGSKYYIGANDDIVSNRLLLGNMFDYDGSDDDA